MNRKRPLPLSTTPTTYSTVSSRLVLVTFVMAVLAVATTHRVFDLNFSELVDEVQEQDCLQFVAVAFYAPGCGHCRRLHPSWARAAEILDHEPQIKLARLDVTSGGGMEAWNYFGLQRIPTVKIFVGNIEVPIPYRGHLDAEGIAAHLGMIQRDWFRERERREKLGLDSAGNFTRRRLDRRGSAAEARTTPATMAEVFQEPAGSQITVVNIILTGSSSPLPSRSPSDIGDRVGGDMASSASKYLLSRFRATVADGLSAVLLVNRDSPKTRHMIAEFRKAGKLLSTHNPPIRAIRVDLTHESAEVIANDDDHGGDTAGARADRDTANKHSSNSSSIKKANKPSDVKNQNTGIQSPGTRRKLGSIDRVRGNVGAAMVDHDELLEIIRRGFAAEIGMPLSKKGGSELRIFLDGTSWMDGGTFRGMPTADGIWQHMQWVAMEGSTVHLYACRPLSCVMRDGLQ